MNEPTNLAQARRTAGNLKLASTPVGAAPVKRKAVAVRSPRALYWQDQYAWARAHKLQALSNSAAHAEAVQFATASMDERFGL